VYYQVVKYHLTDDPERFLETFLALPIRVVGHDLALTLQAAKIKAQSALSYVNCFTVATAIAEHATILTGDPDFRQAEHLVKIEWMG
jgi:predicted nucleic acid-binding protein